ncbi:RIO kinase 1 [Microbacterium trichothecenolyticum]|uniref:serine protein kinase RIO n=1 Tax=Microbacterium trichothecenolyticum TaxID=69370 RepID=UPI00285CFBD6|nr:RIO1 family regulatory kinase/ATPase [Microbacterium trichothecenolyticum]MDR7113859.1 RIO kinase 1 [Microbacterium trichothecenolyticum]
MSSERLDASASVLSPDLEPGPDQRWSTWPASPPTQRGPLPHPEWVVTASGAFDTELGVVKTGKEADVHLIERAVPGTAGVLLAAKRYRNSHHSDFHRSGSYEEGRTMRNTRDARAVSRRSAYGRSVAAGRWAVSEFDALCRAWRAGVPVPYPVHVSDTEVLMEFVGEGRAAAPRLAQSRLHGEQLRSAFDQVVGILEAFAHAGFAHGDLSPYNLLDHDGRVVVIDLPQIVDVAANPQGLDFLHRDVVNVSTWFTRRGLENDPEQVFAHLVAMLW